MFGMSHSFFSSFFSYKKCRGTCFCWKMKITFSLFNVLYVVCCMVLPASLPRLSKKKKNSHFGAAAFMWKKKYIMNRFFQTISQYIFFQHHTYVSELYFFKGDSSLQCTTVALRRKISANICLLSFLAWSMVARKQKWNLKKKTHKNNKRKWNWLGSDIQLRILLLLLGF